MNGQFVPKAYNKCYLGREAKWCYFFVEHNQFLLKKNKNENRFYTLRVYELK